MNKLGILTSGGDAPGMNAAIRAVVIAAQHKNIETMGIKGGYQGLIDRNIDRLTPFDVDGIADKGGDYIKNV
ncbi:6-phosphofructokinase [Priestia filamentosa]|nr:6-phosphofructokinase [Priestia filamentosa]MED3728893.1 6-phosphofructokinase [Priestia filamentosa]